MRGVACGCTGLALVLLAGVAAAAEPSSAGTAEQPSSLQAALYLGPTYQYAAGQRTVFDSFQYLSMGAVVDHEWVHFDVETPGVFLLPDALVMLIAMLAGSDIGPPVFSLLNGEKDPAWMQMISGDLRINGLRSGPHRLSAGVHLGYSIVGPEVDGERLGRSLADLGAAVGYRFGLRRGWVDVSLRGGNGFGSIMDGNPFVGAQAMGFAWLSEDVGLLGRVEGRAQWLDLSDPDEHYLMPNDLAEMVAFGSWSLGVAFRVE
jgi:hypothetical protein